MSATSIPRVTRDLALPAVCRDEGSITMPLNPSPSSAPLALPLSCHFPFPHFHFLLSLTPLESTLIKYPVSVASKELTESLSPLDSALTKKQGGGGVLWLTRIPQRNDAPSKFPSHASRHSFGVPIGKYAVLKLTLCTGGSVATGG